MSMTTWIKDFVRTKLLVLVLALVTVSFLLFPVFPFPQQSLVGHWFIPVAYAQRDALAPLRNLLERTGLYSRPQARTAPRGRRVGGAGRGPICALADNDLRNQVKALIPTPSLRLVENEQASQPALEKTDGEPVGSLTIAEHPNFWFYIPYISVPETSSSETLSKRVAQFVLLDSETNEPVWNELISIELRDHPRLVEYALPYTLEPERLYSWFFSVICDSDKLSRNATIRGWVQRINPTPDLETDADGASYVIADAQGENSLVIGLDTVSAFINAYRNFPNSYREEWESLLQYFEIPETDQFNVLDDTEPLEREVVNGNQLPARI